MPGAGQLCLGMSVSEEFVLDKPKGFAYNLTFI